MIRVGTDCSGIEAPIQALENLGIKYNHVFSCEIDKFARQSIKANYNPEVLYEDITAFKNKHSLDLYVCGFPCQPFSLSGNRLGFKDPRGGIFEHCIKNIINTGTKVFVLENVRGIMNIESGEYWKYILTELNKLTDYNICFKLLNTKNYNIPQNRERLYIVGIRKSAQKAGCKFEFPPSITRTRTVNDFVETHVTHRDHMPVSKESVKNIIMSSRATFLNLGWQNFKEHSYEHYTPSIIAQASMWCVPMHRKATITEILSLQGFPKDLVQVVSNTQFKKQIGNSMSVNVLEHLFREIFKCTDLLSLGVSKQY